MPGRRHRVLVRPGAAGMRGVRVPLRASSGLATSRLRPPKIVVGTSGAAVRGTRLCPHTRRPPSSWRCGNQSACNWRGGGFPSILATHATVQLCAAVAVARLQSERARGTPPSPQVRPHCLRSPSREIKGCTVVAPRDRGSGSSAPSTLTQASWSTACYRPIGAVSGYL